MAALRVRQIIWSAVCVRVQVEAGRQAAWWRLAFVPSRREWLKALFCYWHSSALSGYVVCRFWQNLKEGKHKGLWFSLKTYILTYPITYPLLEAPPPQNGTFSCEMWGFFNVFFLCQTGFNKPISHYILQPSRSRPGSSFPALGNVTFVRLKWPPRSLFCLDVLCK